MIKIRFSVNNLNYKNFYNFNNLKNILKLNFQKH